MKYVFVSLAAGVVSTGGLPFTVTLPLTVAVVVGEIAAPATLEPVVQLAQPAGPASLPLTVTLPLMVVFPWVVMAPMKFMFGESRRSSMP